MKALKLKEISKIKVLLEDGTSYKQKPFCLDNSERNIWNKLKNLNEIRLDYDIFFGVLFDCCGQSFNATGRVSTALCLNLNFRFFLIL